MLNPRPGTSESGVYDSRIILPLALVGFVMVALVVSVLWPSERHSAAEMAVPLGSEIVALPSPEPRSDTLGGSGNEESNFGFDSPTHIVLPIQVRCTAASGESLPGVAVEITWRGASEPDAEHRTHLGVSDSDGSLEVSLDQSLGGDERVRDVIERGPWALHADLAGYLPATLNSKAVALALKASAEVVLTLSAARSVSGLVEWHYSGDPVPFARVAIRQHRSPFSSEVDSAVMPASHVQGLRYVTADAFGEFEIDDLASTSNYSVTVVRQGCLTGQVVVIAPGSEHKVIELRLKQLFAVAFEVRDSSGGPVRCGLRASARGGVTHWVDPGGTDQLVSSSESLTEREFIQAGVSPEYLKSLERRGVRTLIYSGDRRLDEIPNIHVEVHLPGYNDVHLQLSALKLADAISITSYDAQAVVGRFGTLLVEVEGMCVEEVPGVAGAPAFLELLPGDGGHFRYPIDSLLDGVVRIEGVPDIEYSGARMRFAGVRSHAHVVGALADEMPVRVGDTLRFDASRFGAVEIDWVKTPDITGVLVHREDEVGGFVGDVQFASAPYVVIGLAAGSYRITPVFEGQDWSDPMSGVATVDSGQVSALQWRLDEDL